MDGQRWARIWSLWRQRWPSENPGAIWFLSLSQGKVKVGFWLVGGKCCVTKFSHINIDQCQALPNNQMKHYRPLFNQQNPSGAVADMPDWENPRIWRFWASGWLSENASKETSPGHLLNNTRANQTSKWTNTYPTNDNQSHLGAFRHIRPTLRRSEISKIWGFWLAEWKCAQRKRPRGMCLTPLAWHMTNGRVAEWVSASGSPKSARNRPKINKINISFFPTASKVREVIKGWKMVIHTKLQKFW